MENTAFFPCPHCEHQKGCLDLNYLQNPPIAQRALDFFSSLGAPFEIIRGKEEHFRIRSKLAVRGTLENPQIGLFERGTHTIMPIPKCLAHHPSINEAAALILRFMKKEGVIPYNEHHQKQGELRYIQCVVERKTNKVQLALVCNACDLNSPKAQKIKRLAKTLFEEHPHFWHPIWINLNDTPYNQIFSPHWSFLFGERFLWEEICNRKICFTPSSFGQANLSLFERLIEDIYSSLEQKINLCELYAGSAVISLCLLDKLKSSLCIEINPHSKELFEKAKEALDPNLQERIHYLVSSAKESLSLIEPFDALLVDPPRKGLDKELIEKLQKSSNIKTLIYVSCGFDSFQKNTEDLLNEGWIIEKAKGFLFFPGTDHIETLAFFKRK